MRKNNLLSLLPTLQALGVSNSKILGELLRAFELPKDFSEIEVQPPQGPTPSPSAADVANIESGVEEGITSAEKTARILAGGNL